ncbi:hypothetical protein TNCV_4554291 [Trichonephila clavipes]|nr:hypothetical protein TNCV_4554291 [Trichonephila clavipes]
MASPSSNYHTNGRTSELLTDLKCIAPLHVRPLWDQFIPEDYASRRHVSVDQALRSEGKGFLALSVQGMRSTTVSHPEADNLTSSISRPESNKVHLELLGRLLLLSVLL